MILKVICAGLGLGPKLFVLHELTSYSHGLHMDFACSDVSPHTQVHKWSTSSCLVYPPLISITVQLITLSHVSQTARDYQVSSVSSYTYFGHVDVVNFSSCFESHPVIHMYIHI